MNKEDMGEDYPPEYDDDYALGECWNCGGEGLVSSCFEEWACMYPDEGCDLCTRRCDVCRPTKPTAAAQELRKVLGDALAAIPTPPPQRGEPGPKGDEG